MQTRRPQSAVRMAVSYKTACIATAAGRVPKRAVNGLRNSKLSLGRKLVAGFSTISIITTLDT